jgi:hypothetical protein
MRCFVHRPKHSLRAPPSETDHHDPLSVVSKGTWRIFVFFGVRFEHDEMG